MNKKNTKFFPLLLISITILSGCSSLAEEPINSSVPGMQETRSDITNSKMLKDIQISFSLIDSQVVLHQPVFLNFTVQNQLTQPIKLDLGQNFKEGFLFTIVYPNGKKNQPFQLQSEGISMIGDILLKPQGNYSQMILLNEWTEFPITGTYMIEGRLANPIKAEDGKTLDVDSSFVVSLDVKSKNPEHLKKVCNLLFERIIESENFAEASKAALALSYINDSVAVPYLQKALTSDKLVETVIINKLREIGSKNSVEILIRAIKEKPNSNMASMAKSALKWIESQSSDLEAKELIKQFLQNEQKNNV